MTPPKDAQHIGDGVYVWHDGYQFWLATQRDFRWESIALEPSTLIRFVRYIEDWHRARGMK